MDTLARGTRAEMNIRVSLDTYSTAPPQYHYRVKNFITFMKKAERPAMSTKMPDRGYDRQSEVQYEVSAKGDVINLTIQKEDRILSISTNPQSGLLLASDILSAVDTTTNHTIGD